MDFRKLLDDLRVQAEKAATDLELDKRIEQGKDLGEDALEKIKTDRNAQIAAGAGGALLLAALLGSKGGRKMVGSTAKAGVVAGLGALAYKAWQDRQGNAGANAAASDDVKSLGFVTDDDLAPEFAEAMVRTMVAAAWSDGMLDAEERAAIDSALEKAGSDEQARRMLLNEEPEDDTLTKIAAAAKSPNHASQLYTAACIVTGTPNAAESDFLSRLAGILGIESGHASSIRHQVAAG